MSYKSKAIKEEKSAWPWIMQFLGCKNCIVSRMVTSSWLENWAIHAQLMRLSNGSATVKRGESNWSSVEWSIIGFLLNWQKEDGHVTVSSGSSVCTITNCSNTGTILFPYSQGWQRSRNKETIAIQRARNQACNLAFGRLRQGVGELEASLH